VNKKKTQVTQDGQFLGVHYCKPNVLEHITANQSWPSAAGGQPWSS